MIWTSVLWFFIQAALKFFLPKLENGVGPVLKQIIIFILALIGGSPNQAETAAALQEHLKAFQAPIPQSGSK